MFLLLLPFELNILVFISDYPFLFICILNIFYDGEICTCIHEKSEKIQELNLKT